MRCKVYLSDEGYGHIVRQRNIIIELLTLNPNIEFTVQTSHYHEVAKKYIPQASHINKFNNIVWKKKTNGSPDNSAIKLFFDDYKERSSKFIAEELLEFDYDFVITDFVFEAFEIGRLKQVPVFGVCHFTWDWFFSKLYPPPIHSDVMSLFLEYSSYATKLYFPPFTPQEILIHQESRCLQVPFIIRKEIQHKLSNFKDKIKILIADSGAGVISKSIEKCLLSVKELRNVVFFVSDKFKCDNPNVEFIPSDHLMIDYIADMDLVIGRAGFNTICECIGMRTPMLLLGEAMNPEINENMVLLKQQNLASFISLETFENELAEYLPEFFKLEYKSIQSKMLAHIYETNGAEIIAKDIISQL